MTSFTCPVTGSPISDRDIIKNPQYSGVEYITEYGKLKVTDVAWSQLSPFCENRRNRDILRGHIRNNNIDKKDIFEIRSETLNNISIPNNLDSFEAKWIHLLKYIEKRGGRNREPFSLDSGSDYVITYSEDSSEFLRLGEYLLKKGYIKTSNLNSGFQTSMMDVTIEDEGMEVIHTGYKLTILCRLANNIFISDTEVKKKIEHAFKLFNKEGATHEDMRSACKTLADILEPIREKLKAILFSSKDTEIFFSMVNKFDIRHNKIETMKIEFDEQFEWLFYSLLNSIITYYKMIFFDHLPNH